MGGDRGPLDVFEVFRAPCLLHVPKRLGPDTSVDSEPYFSLAMICKRDDVVLRLEQSRVRT